MFTSSIPALNFNYGATVAVTRDRRGKSEFRPGNDFISPPPMINREEPFRTFPVGLKSERQTVADKKSTKSAEHRKTHPNLILMFQCWENPARVVGKRWFGDERGLKLPSKFKQILK